MISLFLFTSLIFSTVFSSIAQPIPIPVSPEEPDPDLLPPVESEMEPKLLPIVPDNHTQDKIGVIFDKNTLEENFLYPFLIFTTMTVITIVIIKKLKK